MCVKADVQVAFAWYEKSAVAVSFAMKEAGCRHMQTMPYTCCKARKLEFSHLPLQGCRSRPVS